MVKCAICNKNYKDIVAHYKKYHVGKPLNKILKKYLRDKGTPEHIIEKY